MSDYRVLITGSREWDDRTAVYGHLDDLLRDHKRLTVVHGACRTGADDIARAWLHDARRTSGLGTAVEEAHPADWNGYGKQAGFIRNAEMVSLGADLCLAFYWQGAGNKGTDHCATQAENAGIRVRRILGPES